VPETNIEIYKRVLEAFNHEGIDGVLEYFAEDVEVCDPDLPAGWPYRGREAVREVSATARSSAGASIWIPTRPSPTPASIRSRPPNPRTDETPGGLLQAPAARHAGRQQIARVS
jgi:hypothetical protein